MNESIEKSSQIDEATLNAFCAKNDLYRKYLHHPFYVGDNLVATNGEILAAIPSTAPAITETNPISDRVKVLLDGVAVLRSTKPIEHDDGWISVGSITWDKEELRCDECAGTGKLNYIPCVDCDGEGFFYRGRHTYNCKECDGDGTKAQQGGDGECSRCCGTGTHLRGRVTSFVTKDGYTISAQYIKLLQDVLPEARLHSKHLVQGAVPMVCGRTIGAVMQFLQAPYREQV